MTLYARTDLCSTAVPRSSGGCGETHTRPVENGAPAKLWALNCPGCESDLRDHPLWSSTISEIPETHDEKITREDQEKRGIRERDQATGKALEQLGDLPTALDRLARALLNRDGTESITETCPNGHEALSGSRFCGECGSPMLPLSASIPRREAYSVTHNLPAEPSDTAPSQEALEAMGLPELREIAARHDIKSARSKADQIKLITEHFAAGGQ